MLSSMFLSLATCHLGYIYVVATFVIFHHLHGWRLRSFTIAFSQVPLSKLDRVKNIARSSLVTLPKFVQDQGKYKAILKQIGRLNGILPEKWNPGVGPNQSIQRRAKSLSPNKRRTRPVVASAGKEAAASPHQKQVLMGLSKRKPHPQKPDTSPPPPSVACRGAGDEPVKSLATPPPPAAPPPSHAAAPEKTRGLATTRNMVQDSSHFVQDGKGPAAIREAKTTEATGFTGNTGEHARGVLPDQGVGCFPTQQGAHQLGGEGTFEAEPIRPCTRPPSVAGDHRRPYDRSLNASKPSFNTGGTPRKILSSSPVRAGSVSRPCSAGGFTALGRRVSGSSLVIGTQGWSLAGGEDHSHGSGEGYAVEQSSALLLPHLGTRT